MLDAVTGESSKELKRPNYFVVRAIFSPDGGRILTVGSDGTVLLWDAATGEEVKKFKGSDRQVHDAAFSRDGRRIVTAGEDGTPECGMPTRGRR